MVPVEGYIALAVFAVAVLVMLFFAVKKWLLFIQLVRRQSISIGRAFRGTVEITGKAQPENVKTSPFSKQECIYYSYEVQKYVSSGKSNYWHTKKKAKTKGLVVLEDGTGSMRIDLKGANLHLKETYWIPKGNTFKEIIHALKTFDSTNILDAEMERTNSHGKTLGGHKFLGLNLGGDRVRCIERAIFPGDELYAYGTVDRRRVMSTERGDLIVSYKGEKSVQNRTLFFAILLTVGLIVAAAVAFLVQSGIVS